jgi:membrane carboxypeptidase/penicillin-binding protein PbpC
MQVARLLDPHPRTFGGKLRQLWRALQLEWHLSKSEILTPILTARLWRHAAGIGAASWAYLGKPRAAQLWRSGAAGRAAAGAESFTSGPLAAAGSGGAR